MTKKIIAAGLSLLLIGSDFAICAAADKDVYGNTQKEQKNDTAAPQSPSTSSGAKEPLIEVSVDALEISESNSKVLGVLWGQQGPVTNGIPAFDANHLNFLETVPTPAVFDAGKFIRSGLFGQLQ